MKILSILSQKPSSTGSGVYMGELVKSFDKIGAKQAIICGQDLNQPNDYEFARHIEDLKVYSVDFNSEALPFDMFGMSDVMPYPSQRYQDMTSDQLKKYKEAFVAVMKTAMEEFRPDLIISHHLYLATSFFIETFGSKNLGAICHGTDLRQLNSNGKNREEIIGRIREAEKVFVLQEDQKNDVSRLFNIEKERIKIIGNSFNSEIFHIKDIQKDKERLKDKVELVYAGKIAKSKGLLSLIRAINQIDNYQIRLKLAGGIGDLEEYEEIKILAQSSPHEIEFSGQMDQHQLADLFNRSDLFVLPSYYEGLALVCVEAAACGLPVVATNTSGIKDHVSGKLNKDHFIFVDLPAMHQVDEPVEESLPEFESALAEAIREHIRVLEEGSFHREYLKKELFSWDYVARSILEEFTFGKGC